LFQGEMKPTPSHNTQLILPSGIAVNNINWWLELPGFNNEVQHLEEQEGACYSKWLWENNTGI